MQSLLERIVDKARLIADMMCKMQNKIKDSNLRNINNGLSSSGLALLDNGNQVKKGPLSAAGDDDMKFGGVKITVGNRQRKYSTQEKEVVSEKDLCKPAGTISFLATLTSAMGVPDFQRLESKKRGMSDVDD